MCNSNLESHFLFPRRVYIFPSACKSLCARESAFFRSCTSKIGHYCNKLIHRHTRAGLFSRSGRGEQVHAVYMCTYLHGWPQQRKSMQLAEPVVKMNCTNGCDCTQERQPRKLIRHFFPRGREKNIYKRRHCRLFALNFYSRPLTRGDMLNW